MFNFNTLLSHIFFMLGLNQGTEKKKQSLTWWDERLPKPENFSMTVQMTENTLQ